MIYTSVENSKIKDIKKLHLKKYRDQESLFLIEGEHLVLEAFKAGVLKTLIVGEESSFSLEVDTMVVSSQVLSYLSELETPQPIMGVCRKLKSREITGNVVVLDNIQDPGNLGTIIRSAVAFNIDTLLLSKGTVDFYNEKVLRASQGLVFHLNIVVEDLEKILPFLKSKGYSLIGTKVTNGKDIKSVEKKYPFAIIMGNEGKGVSKEVEFLCDDFAYIKMHEKCERLNVGVATSILMYELDK